MSFSRRYDSPKHFSRVSKAEFSGGFFFSELHLKTNPPPPPQVPPLEQKKRNVLVSGCFSPNVLQCDGAIPKEREYISFSFFLTFYNSQRVEQENIFGRLDHIGVYLEGRSDILCVLSAHLYWETLHVLIRAHCTGIGASQSLRNDDI